MATFALNDQLSNELYSDITCYCEPYVHSSKIFNKNILVFIKYSSFIELEINILAMNVSSKVAIEQ